MITPFTLFLVHSSNGDTDIRAVDPDDLLRKINSGWYGDNPQFLDALPDTPDTNYWPEGSFLLIKGEIVVPKPRQVIIEYEL